VAHLRNDDEGKFTLSLNMRDWFFLVAGVVAAVLYVSRLEMAVARHESHMVKADSLDAKQGSDINSQHWRLRRIERKLKIKREG
jgi:hypothetical protein